MFSDWTDWTFWVTALALVAFGFNLRVIYEQWRSRKMRKRLSDEAQEISDLTQRLQTATERLNKANADSSSKPR
jgi:type VI protein secretion system component VasK